MRPPCGAPARRSPGRPARRGREHRVEHLLLGELRPRLVVARGQEAAEVCAGDAAPQFVLRHPGSCNEKGAGGPAPETPTRSRRPAAGAVLADVVYVRLRALVFLQAERLLRLQHLGDLGIRVVLVAEDARLGRTDLDACGLQAVAGAVVAERALLDHARLAHGVDVAAPRTRSGRRRRAGRPWRSRHPTPCSPRSPTSRRPTSAA